MFIHFNKHLKPCSKRREGHSQAHGGKTSLTISIAEGILFSSTNAPES